MVELPYSKQGMESEAIVFPQYMEDINVDQIISFITKHYTSYHLDEYYLVLPDEATKKKRKTIWRDLRIDAVYQSMKELLKADEQIEKQRSLERDCTYRYQSMKLYLDSCYIYFQTLRNLQSSLQSDAVQSEGLKDLLERVNQTFFSEEAIELEKEVNEIVESYHQISFTVCFDVAKEKKRTGLITNKKLDVVRIVTSQKDKDMNTRSQNYQEKIANLLRFPLDLLQDSMPFPSEKEINELERSILKILCKSNPEPFTKMEKLYRKGKEYYNPEFKKLTRECAFYVSYIEFVLSMQRLGYLMTEAEQKGEQFSVINGYDLALVLQSMEHGGKVVSNNFEYRNKERFFVVTGPNQGGKTTFARMLGQQVYFAQMGFLIPASYGCIPNFDAIYSHFAKDEAKELGAGKLKEELLRLGPIIDVIKSEQSEKVFVIINELFTTAATYDAVLMGHKVIDYLCGHNCYGVYVTHVRELAEGREEIASLTAEVQDDAYRTRTYKITRHPSSLGHAQSLAYRYGLTYEQMKRRMPK